MAEVEARACTSSCLDVCWAGPCIAVEPDHFVYGRVQDGDLEAIVEGLAGGSRVERLVLGPSDFELPRELRERESAEKKRV